MQSFESNVKMLDLDVMKHWTMEEFSGKRSKHHVARSLRALAKRKKKIAKRKGR
jgi:hypothetical protein